MGYSPSQQAYAQSVGTASTQFTWIDVRDPTAQDVNYKIGTFWINTADETQWYLNSFSSAGGVVTANWVSIEGALNTLSDTAGTLVTPNNGDIQLFNSDGAISIVSDPGNNRIVFGLTGGGVAFDQINVDDFTAPGTDPVLPSGTGQLTITGGQIANASLANVIQTNSLAANTFTIQIQQAASAAATDSTKNGVAHFNSAQFTVDASGFVSLSGGGAAVDSFTPDSGTSPVVPNGSGNVAIQGQSTPNTSGIAVVGGLNALNLTMQSPFANDFTFYRANGSAGTRFLNATNDDLTATSDAVVRAITSGGDPYYASLITGTSEIATFGIDRSDSFKVKISRTSPSSGTDFAVFDPNGDITITPLSGSNGNIVLNPDGTGDVNINTGNLNVVRSDVGGDVIASIENTDNTNAGSDAVLLIETGGASSGDAYIAYQITGTTSWSAGVDNNDSDSYVISAAGALGTNNVTRVTPAGAYFLPTVPSTAITSGQVLVMNSTNGQVGTLTLTNGQLAIGSTGATPVAANITAGAGISIANGAGSITVSATGSGFAWADGSGAIAVVSNRGYFITATSTATLPASPTEGDAVSFIVDTTQILTIQATGTQVIRVGNTVSAAAGTCVSTLRGDAISLVYRSTGTAWIADGGPQGNWVVT